MRRQKIDLNFGHLMPKKEGMRRGPGESSFNNAKPLLRIGMGGFPFATQVNPLQKPAHHRPFPPIRPRMTANLPT